MVLPQLGWLTKSALWKSENWATLWFGTHRIWTTSATALEAIWSKKLSKEAEWYRRAIEQILQRQSEAQSPFAGVQTAKWKYSNS